MNHDRFLAYATAAAGFSRLHGPAHWARVASLGEWLSRETPGADPHVVALFAALHDTQRYTDYPDPYHGRRAAEVASKLHQRGIFTVTDEQLRLLLWAVAEHVDGLVSDEPTVAVCWDADRLDVPRCGVAINPAMLSTPAAAGLTRRRIALW